MSNLNEVICPFDSGHCFVEERRTWGYVTEIQAGCEQKKTCEKQKSQNFNVKASRQCWPGDHSG
jgi:hypothetical protein